MPGELPTSRWLDRLGEAEKNIAVSDNKISTLKADQKDLEHTVSENGHDISLLTINVTNLTNAVGTLVETSNKSSDRWFNIFLGFMSVSLMAGMSWLVWSLNQIVARGSP